MFIRPFLADPIINGLVEWRATDQAEVNILTDRTIFDVEEVGRSGVLLQDSESIYRHRVISEIHLPSQIIILNVHCFENDGPNDQGDHISDQREF